MMEMSLPRTSRISDSCSVSNSLPLNAIAPDGWWAFGYGNSFMIERAVTDLPEPDSPTRATVSPFLMSNDTRSTASTCRSPCPKATDKSRTERSGADDCDVLMRLPARFDVVVDDHHRRCAIGGDRRAHECP